MAKSVLLARPHPFLVSDMRPWLEQAGFEVQRSDTLPELSEKAPGSVGAIISLAVASPIGASAEEVFLALRRSRPALPVLFAALRPFEQAAVEIERLLKRIGIAGSVISLDSEAGRALGTADSFLYVAKDDLADPVRRAEAKALLVRHFH